MKRLLFLLLSFPLLVNAQTGTKGYTIEGKLIIFSAPSGAGKTTIVHHLLKVFPDLEFSVSACSREMRKGEAYGVDYYFLSVDEFKDKIERGEC